MTALLALVLSILVGTVDGNGPVWGCGLSGVIPGIDQAGGVNSATRRLIDGLKRSSSFGKVPFWNWNFVPRSQHLSHEFMFMPCNWGIVPGNRERYQRAGAVGFWANGHHCPAEMADVLLYTNEPDITGSCMGSMMGRCTGPCTGAEMARWCPVAHRHGSRGEPLPNGHCNCGRFSHATSAGFWPLRGCSKYQPLPTLWQDNDAGCIGTVMGHWRQHVQNAVSKGYKYLTTPQVATDIGYARRFLELACGCSGGRCRCRDASCGCPVYVAFHFYAYDCQPEGGDYDTFQARLDGVRQIMEDYPFVRGAIVNEVGMLNCRRNETHCVPDTGKHPASSTPGGSCPSTPSLPDGMKTFLRRMMDMAVSAKTRDGRAVVKSFTWFNHNRAGATYDLRLFDDSGALNQLGEAYLEACSKWPL